MVHATGGNAALSRGQPSVMIRAGQGAIVCRRASVESADTEEVTGSKPLPQSRGCPARRGTSAAVNG
jgi:hypothetical protein